MTERELTSETGDSQLNAVETIQVSQAFIEYFGVEANPLEQADEFIATLDQLDPRYKGGRDLVRWQLEEDQTEWPEDAKEVIGSTAENLHMFGETPLVGKFDAVIVLGAARQANLDRLRYAAQAIKEGKATTSHLMMTGSKRKLNEAEQTNTSNYAPGAETEFDLVAAAANTVAKENPGLAITILELDDEKASTEDAFKALFNDLQTKGMLRADITVAAITTQIYQQFTALDFNRVGKQFGVNNTSVAGNPSDPNIVAKRTPATYISEINRNLKAAAKNIKQDKEPPTDLAKALLAGSKAVSWQTAKDEARQDEKRSFGYRWRAESEDEEVGHLGHGIIYRDSSTGEDYLVGLDDNGRGYSPQTEGLFYEDWNDPGTYDM